MLDQIDDGFEIGEVDLRMDALAVQIQPERNQVHVARALAVPKQTALNPLGPSHLSQFGGGGGAAAVVVRMQRHAALASLAHVPTEVLDLIGVHVGRGHLDGGRQVEDHRSVARRLPRGLDRLADANDIRRVRVGEALRAELELPLRPTLAGIVLGDGASVAGTPHGQLDALVRRESKHDPLEALARGQVDVQDSLAGSTNGVDGASDEVFSAWREHLQPDVGRRRSSRLHQASSKVKVGLRGRGKGDFDLLVAELHELVEVSPFLLAVLTRPVRWGNDSQTCIVPSDPPDSGCHLAGRWTASVAAYPASWTATDDWAGPAAGICGTSSRGL